MNEFATVSESRTVTAHGIFNIIGKLGRNNVILISNGEIELPSDLQGVVYTNEKNWEIDLVKELKAMGYSIDMNKMI